MSDTPPRSGSKPPGGWEAPSLETMQALLPQYQFLSMIGRGGMGAVYKACQVSLDRLVAIKVLPGDLLDDTDVNFVQRFKQEARTMARMNHPAIVAVYDFGQTEGGLLYFVMEFVDGTDVAQMILAQRRLPSDHALAITAHVCDALAYAHGHGVVHRDIKPANVLINMEGQVKVADFGLAKANDAPEHSLTKTNMAMGTPDFVAPEALMPGVSLDGRADLYAVGVMLYQMLTGEIPRGLWQMPSLKVGADARFDAIIAKAMQTDREMRYQSSLEIRQDLDRIVTMPIVQAGGQASVAIPKQAMSAQKPVGKSPSPPRKEESPPPALKKTNGSGLLMALGFGAVSCVVLAFVVHALRKPAPPEAPIVAATPAPSAPRKTPAKKVAAKPPEPAPLKAFTEKAPGFGAQAVDILPLIDLAQDVVAPEWKIEGGNLMMTTKPVGKAAPRVALPRAATGSFLLETQFTPAADQGILVLHLPFGKVIDARSAVTARIHIREKSSIGFELIRGKPADSSDNPTHVGGVDLPKGKPQRLLTRVELKSGKKIALAFWLNGDPLMGWEGPLSDITGFAAGWLPGSSSQNARCIVIGATCQGLQIHRLRLQAIDGELRSVRPDKPAPVAATTPAPVPGAAPVPAPVPAAPDPIAIRLREIEKQFQDAYEKQVTSIHKTAVADLNQKYVSALDRAIATASQASKLDEALKLREEKELIQTQAAIPAEDGSDFVPAIKALRDTYRKAFASVLTHRDQLAAPLYAAYDKALANYQDELTRAQKLDEAQRVKAVRDHVTAQRTTPAAPETAATITPVVGTSPKAGIPTAPPLPADKVLPPLPKASAEEIRELVTWCLGVKKGNVRVLDNGKTLYVTNMDQLPRGKLAVTTFYVYGMDAAGEDKKWFSIMTRMPELEEIKFSQNPGVFPMEELRSMTGLKNVRLAPQAVDDAAFAHLTGLKQLESLTLTYWCQKFTGTGLGYINENLQELETDSKNLSAEGLAYLPRFKKLRRLRLADCTGLSDSMLQPLAAMPALEELNVSQTNLDGSFLAHVPASLKRLWLEDTKKFKVEHLPLLARFKNLEFVSLPPLEIKPAEMAALAGLPKLASISIDFTSAFTGEGFAGVKGFGALKSLTLHESRITDVGWRAIGESLPGLQSLTFSRYANEKTPFTGAAFGEHLGKLRNLTALQALHDGLTDDWLPHIARLKNLTSLSLQGAGVTDAGLPHLKDLPVENLRIDQTAVTDAAIPVLKTFPKLRYVNTNDNKMTPQGVEDLKRGLKR